MTKESHTKKVVLFPSTGRTTREPVPSDELKPNTAQPRPTAK